MVYGQPGIRPEEWDAQPSLRFWDTNGSPNLGQTTRHSDSQQKKSTIWTQIKLKESKKDKYLDLAKELKKTMKLESDDTNCNWCTLNNPKRIGKGTGKLGTKKASGDHPDYSILKSGQNIEKKPGDMGRLAVSQTLVENHQLMLVWKILKALIMINWKNVAP